MELLPAEVIEQEYKGPVDPEDKRTWDTLTTGEKYLVVFSPKQQIEMRCYEVRSRIVRLVRATARRGNKSKTDNPAGLSDLRKICQSGQFVSIKRMKFEIMGRTAKNLRLGPRGYVNG
jgi:hypothetical protein